MRGVPETPESHYILRQQFVDTICNYLIKIDGDQDGGHVLVHGLAGSGKTIAVSQAVRYVVKEEQSFAPHGVYWIKIGILKDKLQYIIPNFQSCIRVNIFHATN